MASVFQTYKKDGTAHPRWRFEYRDRLGRKRRGTGFTSKKETFKLAQQLEAEEHAIRKGYIDAPKPSLEPRSFRAVADEYLAWGDTQGGRGGRPWGTRHSMTRHRHMTWWEEELKLDLLSDLVGCLPRVEASLRGLLSKELTNRTVAMHAESLCAFCRWCVERDYLDEDPLRKLRSFDVTPVKVRRAMTVEEVDALLAASPVERQLLYEVALCTGLRANELRNLTVRHLDLERYGLRLDAAWTKNRKAGFQPLPADLVHRLAEFAVSGHVGLKTERFYGRWDVQEPPKNRLLYVLSNPIKAFDADLEAAGVAKVTSEGKLDFHALRVTYTTFLIESGATVKEAQTLLRHSTPDITMNTYARVRPGRLNEVTEGVSLMIRPNGRFVRPGERECAPLANPPSVPVRSATDDSEFRVLMERWNQASPDLRAAAVALLNAAVNALPTVEK